MVELEYMKIGVAGSMQHTEKMIEARDELIHLGHDAFVTKLADAFVGKSDKESWGHRYNKKGLPALS